MSSDIKTVFFDLDGTLINHLGSIHACYVHTLPKVGLPAPSLQQVKNAIGGGLENAMSRLVPKEKLTKALSIYRKHWEKIFLDDVSLLPGADALLEDLHQRGLKLAVLSNKVGDSSRTLCEHLRISHYFLFILGAQDTPWLKPDKRLIRYALDKLDAQPEESALVGDSPWDVQSALNAYITPMMVTTGTHSAKQLF